MHECIPLPAPSPIIAALSMPVHWYYNPSDITRDYGGPIARFEAPKVSGSRTDGAGDLRGCIGVLVP